MYKNYIGINEKLSAQIVEKQDIGTMEYFIYLPP